MANKLEKDFDAVASMREIRDRISKETEGMNFEEFQKYIEAKIPEKYQKMYQDSKQPK
ncbi:MAG: hypothetical protein KDK23_15430 [Leptospiraceae bacterium]|nr:hypothetical protein [Leptospiraceae bacterium]